MLDVVIIGASGYIGSELVKKLAKHEKVNLQGLYVSKDSKDADKNISTLYPCLQGVTDLSLTPLYDEDVESIANDCDVVFLATDSEISVKLTPIFLEHKCYVFDLSSAFYINDIDDFKARFKLEDNDEENTINYEDILNKAAYGISEWCDILSVQQSHLISIPSPYATASHIALRPLLDSNLLDLDYKPSINAIAGASILGRRASLDNSFCEISLKAQELFKHKDLFEIKYHLNTGVILNSHIDSFKRGLLTTITAKLNKKLDYDSVKEIFIDAYRTCPLVRVQDNLPSIADVENTPFSAIGFEVDEDGYIVISCALDNLLKGGASHAIQLMNLYFNLEETQSII